MSEPKGRGAAWTEERGTSDEGRRRLTAPRRRAEDTAIADELRHVLAGATGRSELLRITLDTPLFGTAVALDSLTGTLLLREVRHRFGVDVAREDLNLDALATLGTLAAFVSQRTPLTAGSG
ncbi:MAG TPA: acyl carrier protein [Streptosporangiaceae bacterium]|nr:acyl carrier protein [Streptosporangiaceae bacterium]